VGDDDWQLVTVGRRERPPISPVLLQKVRLQGFIGKLFCPLPMRSMWAASLLLETDA
jgi:hypothetical protein